VVEDGNNAVESGLAELLNTLSLLKDQSRRPTPSAYRDLIQFASQYDTFRSVPVYQGTSPSRQTPRESLGWDIASAALEDAERGQVELSPEAYDLIASVSTVS
jgi:hypothetical protein